MMRDKSLNRAVYALAALVAVVGVVKTAEAQFVAPTCVPPLCNPSVIQNIGLAGTAQTAGINISDHAKVGQTIQAGATAPTLTLATENLFYGNVNAASVNASLLLLQVGAVDRLRVSLAGQMQLPLGSAAAPSYTFIGDTNTGLYSSGADSVSTVTGGTVRTTFNSTGTTVNNGVLAVPTGSAAAPSITFTGDTNTGIYRSAADQINLTTNGVSRMMISSTGTVVIPYTLQANGGIIGTMSGTISGDGSGLTNLNASNLASGTVPDGRISGTYTTAVTFNNASNSFTGSYAGDGSALTNLNASNITSGTLNDGRLSTNVALYNANGAYTGANTFSNASNSFTGSGAGLTSLNASNLSSGTVPSARISGTYSNNLTFSGNNSYTGMSTFGSATRVIGAGQNLIYGNIDTTSVGNLLLLQNESVDQFRVAANGDTSVIGNFYVRNVTDTATVFSVDQSGNLTASGTGAFTGSLTVGGQNVCLQDGSNCPATLTGSGTPNYVVKFTGTGDTVGNSVLYEDGGGNVGIGTSSPSAKLSVNGSISAQTVSTYLVAAGAAGVTGQVVGVGSYGVVGSGGSYGVYGSSGGYGVYGYNTSAGGSGAGVYGYHGGTGPGVQGSSLAGWGGSFSSLYVTPGIAYFASGATIGSGVLTLANAAADPGGANGAMYYNTGSNTFRCYANGAWGGCGVAGSGTTNYIPKFTGATTLGNSAMSDNGSTVNSSLPIYATTAGLTAFGGTAGGGSGAVSGQATGAGIVYGVQGYTTGTTDVNSAGVRGSGQNGVFGYSNVVNGVGVKAQAYTNADTAVNALVSTSVGAPNTRAVLASNVSTTAGSNQAINAQATGVNAGTNVGIYLNASGATNNYALVTVGGNVGFYDQTPTSPVVVGIDGSAAAPAFSIGAGDDNNTGFFRPGADTIAMATNGVERLRVGSTGLLTVPAVDGHRFGDAAEPFSVTTEDIFVADVSRAGVGVRSTAADVEGMYFADDSGIVVYGSFSGHETQIRAGNSQKIRIMPNAAGDIILQDPNAPSLNTGRVGVGTASPTEKLHVAGTVKADTGILFSGTMGGLTTADSWIRDEGGYMAIKSRDTTWGTVIRNNSSSNYINLESGTTYGTLGWNTADGPLYFDGGYVGVRTTPWSGTSLNIYGNGVTYGAYSSYPTYAYYGYSSSYAFLGYSNGNALSVTSYCGAGCFAGHFANAGIDTRLSYYNGGIYWGLYTNGDAYIASWLGLGLTPTYRLTLPNSASTSGRGLANQWVVYSDARYKENIKTIRNPLEIVKKLRPVTFTWKDQDGKTDLGFIAQEVEPVLPDLVSSAADGYLGLDYGRMVAPAIGAIQELDLKIENMEAVIEERLDGQDKRIKELEERVEELERRLEASR